MVLTYADYCADGPSWRQRDLTVTQTYDTAYLETRYAGIAPNVRALAAKRARVLLAYAPAGRLLDYGCGTGAFVDAANAAGWAASGYDVIPSRLWLPRDRLHAYAWSVVTFFDVLEHLTDPAGTIRALAAAAVMVSVPECHYPHNPDWFMAWKHRRPGEHLWHWNRDTLRRFMAELGYGEVMASHFEDAYRPHPEQPEPNILSAIYRRGI